MSAYALQAQYLYTKMVKLDWVSKNMIKISKLADYSFLILDQLGQNDKTIENKSSQKITAQVLAETTKIPLPTVRKLLALLLKAELVESSDGYRLRVPLNRITVLNVLRVIDGDWALTACQKEEKCCDHIKRCRLASGWGVVNHWITSMLGQITVTDMVSGLDNHVWQQTWVSEISEVRRESEQSSHS